MWSNHNTYPFKIPSKNGTQTSYVVRSKKPTSITFTNVIQQHPFLDILNQLRKYNNFKNTVLLIDSYHQRINKTHICQKNLSLDRWYYSSYNKWLLCKYGKFLAEPFTSELHCLLILHFSYTIYLCWKRSKNTSSNNQWLKEQLSTHNHLVLVAKHTNLKHFFIIDINSRMKWALSTKKEENTTKY